MIQTPGHRAPPGTSRSCPAGKNHPSMPCLSAQCCPRGLGASLSEHSLPLLLCTSAGNSNLARTGRARLGSRSLGRLETLLSLLLTHSHLARAAVRAGPGASNSNVFDLFPGKLLLARSFPALSVWRRAYLFLCHSPLREQKKTSPPTSLDLGNRKTPKQTNKTTIKLDIALDISIGHRVAEPKA